MKRMMIVVLISLCMAIPAFAQGTATPTPTPTSTPTATPSSTPTPTPELNVLLTVDPPGIDPREAVVTFVIHVDQVFVAVLSFLNLLVMVQIAGLTLRD